MRVHDAKTARFVKEDGGVNAVQVIAERHVSEMSFCVDEVVEDCEIRFGGVHAFVDEARVRHGGDVAEGGAKMIALGVGIGFWARGERLGDGGLKGEGVCVEAKVFVGHLQSDFEI